MISYLETFPPEIRSSNIRKSCFVKPSDPLAGSRRARRGEDSRPARVTRPRGWSCHELSAGKTGSEGRTKEPSPWPSVYRPAIGTVRVQPCTPCTAASARAWKCLPCLLARAAWEGPNPSDYLCTRRAERRGTKFLLPSEVRARPRAAACSPAKLPAEGKSSKRT